MLEPYCLLNARLAIAGSRTTCVAQAEGRESGRDGLHETSSKRTREATPRQKPEQGAMPSFTITFPVRMYTRSAPYNHTHIVPTTLLNKKQARKSTHVMLSYFLVFSNTEQPNNKRSSGVQTGACSSGVMFFFVLCNPLVSQARVDMFLRRHSLHSVFSNRHCFNTLLYPPPVCPHRSSRNTRPTTETTPDHAQAEPGRRVSA